MQKGDLVRIEGMIGHEKANNGRLAFFRSGDKTTSRIESADGQPLINAVGGKHHPPKTYYLLTKHLQVVGAEKELKYEPGALAILQKLEDPFAVNNGCVVVLERHNTSDASWRVIAHSKKSQLINSTGNPTEYLTVEQKHLKLIPPEGESSESQENTEMATATTEKKETSVKKYNADVEREGDKIILPAGANIPDIIEVLQRKHDEERQSVRVKAEIAVPPWDGALALQWAIEKELGIVITNSTVGFWGDKNPPQEMEVEVEYGKTVTVKWGEFALPGMGSATAVTAVSHTAGEWMFVCQVTCQRRYQERAKRLLDTLRTRALSYSVHRGKAFSIRFVDDAGEQIAMPTPKFFQFAPDQPIFRRELEAAIDRNVFTPIRHARALRAMGEPLKRGVMFAGDYGTGKTLLASFVGQFSVQHDWTFLYVKHPAELPMALKYAQRLQPIVVFVEDLDRIAGIERTESVNSLLNQLDGIDSKHAEIMTILTTNHSDRVNPAMRRPGRIDVVLQVLPPDQDTIKRMAIAFSNNGLVPETDLSIFAEVLEGLAPAYVREAVGRARLEALRRTGDPSELVSGDDLAAVAREVKTEKDLFTPKTAKEDKESPLAVAAGFEAAAGIMRKVAANSGKGKPASAGTQ